MKKNRLYVATDRNDFGVAIIKFVGEKIIVFDRFYSFNDYLRNETKAEQWLLHPQFNNTYEPTDLIKIEEEE